MVWAILRDLAERQVETEKKFEQLWLQSKETDKQLDKVGWQIKETNQQLGGMDHNQGRFAEVSKLLVKKSVILLPFPFINHFFIVFLHN